MSLFEQYLENDFPALSVRFEVLRKRFILNNIGFIFSRREEGRDFFYISTMGSTHCRIDDLFDDACIRPVDDT